MSNNKIKIEIKSILGRVIFSYEKENNTIKDTLIKCSNAVEEEFKAFVEELKLQAKDYAYRMSPNLAIEYILDKIDELSKKYKIEESEK